MRVRSIDIFRGSCVILMVLIGLVTLFSYDLPEVMVHAEPDSLHFGDFVLSMFLFASGMSLVFFHRKRRKLKKTEYAAHAIGRSAKLGVVAVMLSPFASFEILGMNVVMLNAILSLPTLLLIRYSEKISIMVAVAVSSAYLMLKYTMLLPDLNQYYLGGYQAAIFFLPIMLAGTIAGKRMEEIDRVFIISIPVALILLLLVAPYRSVASPSFVALSITVSLGAYILLRNLKNEVIEYLGRKSLRYWVMLFITIVIAGLISLRSGYEIKTGFMEALVISTACLGIFYLVSKVIDMTHAKLNAGVHV